MLKPLRFQFVPLLTLATVLSNPMSAQDKQAVTSRHALYAELLGQGVLYSLNYDYRVLDDMSLRAGFTSWTVHGFLFDDFSVTGFPLMVNYLTGSGTSHLELGVGVIPMTVTADDFLGFDTGTSSESRFFGTATVGYRAQSPDGGLVFRIGLTPLFTFEQAALYGGVSLGVALQ